LTIININSKIKLNITFIRIKQKMKKNITLVVIAAALLLSLAGYIYLRASSSESSTSIDTESNTEATSSKSDKPEPTKQNPKISVQNEKTPQASETEQIGVTITSAQEIDGTLRVRTFIDNITNQGTCEITLIHSNDKTEYTDRSGIQSLPNGATCKGFDIPVSKLKQGEWEVTVSVEAQGKNGKATRIVEI
jgi:flagellar basal body-associated protein FliL